MRYKTKIIEWIAIPSLVLTCSLAGYYNKDSFKRTAIFPQETQRVLDSIDNKVLGAIDGTTTGLGLAYVYALITRRKIEE